MPGNYHHVMSIWSQTRKEAVTKSGTGTWDSGLGDVGLRDTQELGDVINKQHLTFALNL